MKLISWNVNGIRACLGKDFMKSFEQLDADVFCLQETKCQEGQVALDLPGYTQFWYSAERKGYSGTAIFARREPLRAVYGIGVDEFDHEGRVIALESPEYWMVTVYTPNSQEGLVRLPYRIRWEQAFRGYLKDLEKTHPVIVCGDMNVAHEEIDIRNPRTNTMNAGFTKEERACMTELLGSGFVDTFRCLHPDEAGAYSWWSYRFHAREKNVGWRIDYFLVSEALRGAVAEASIRQEIFGSDHCPVQLTLDLEKA